MRVAFKLVPLFFQVYFSSHQAILFLLLINFNTENATVLANIGASTLAQISGATYLQSLDAYTNASVYIYGCANISELAVENYASLHY
jgi:hypothetical protein